MLNSRYTHGLDCLVPFLAILLILGSAACVASTPRPADWPAPECGDARGEWKLAELLPHYTKILAQAPWSKYTLGDVSFMRKVGVREGNAEVQVRVRVKPWAGATGVSLFWADREYELPLVSATPSGCYYLSLKPGLALFRARSNVDLVYISVLGGWVKINPNGGSTL